MEQVGSQDAEKLRREHDRTVLGTLAVADLEHHAVTVDIRDLQADRFRGAQPCGVGRRQCRARLQGRHRLEETHNLVGSLRGVRA